MLCSPCDLAISQDMRTLEQQRLQEWAQLEHCRPESSCEVDSDCAKSTVSRSLFQTPGASQPSAPRAPLPHRTQKAATPSTGSAPRPRPHGHRVSQGIRVYSADVGPFRSAARGLPGFIRHGASGTRLRHGGRLQAAPRDPAHRAASSSPAGPAPRPPPKRARRHHPPRAPTRTPSAHTPRKHADQRPSASSCGGWRREPTAEEADRMLRGGGDLEDGCRR